MIKILLLILASVTFLFTIYNVYKFVIDAEFGKLDEQFKTILTTYFTNDKAYKLLLFKTSLAVSSCKDALNKDSLYKIRKIINKEYHVLVVILMLIENINLKKDLRKTKMLLRALEDYLINDLVESNFESDVEEDWFKEEINNVKNL